MPLPFCRAAIVVGPAKEGIQKNPSVRSPLMRGIVVELDLYVVPIGTNIEKDEMDHIITSLATLERAL